MNMLTTIPAADRIVALSDNMPPDDLLSPPAELPAVTPPKTLIQRMRETYRSLSTFLAGMPVITTLDEAKQTAEWIETVRKSLQDLDAERRSKVDPLNEQVKSINDEYRPVREAFENKNARGLLDETKRRHAAYLLAEEERRRAEAEALRKAAEEAEALARAAEAAEADAKAAVDVGECDLDIGDVIAQADEAFADFQAVNRMAARAERAIPVRVPSRFGGRATGLRNKEVLEIDDACTAIAIIGLTENIRDAILSGARDYRKLHGELPAGITSTIERSL